MCTVWLLVAALVVGVARGASKCWENPSCQELNSESSIMECLQLCHSLSEETPITPGDAHMQAPPPSFLTPQVKRSYSMEHFRWGKPMGKKRRPVKVYTSNAVEEESAEVFPREMRRRDLAEELLAAAAMVENGELEAEEQQLLNDEQEKEDGTYKMKHFRWGGPSSAKRYQGPPKADHHGAPPAEKRYGGFMKSWDTPSQRPLLTLFKNVINKDIERK
ncbi:proopiomelanocortin a [Neosynchiropus ocellatus]